MSHRAIVWPTACAAALSMLAPLSYADDHEDHDHASSEHVHAEAEASSEKSEVEELKEKTALLKARYEYRLQELRSDMLDLEVERQRLANEKSHREAKLTAELESKRAEVERIQADLSLRDARQRASLAELKREIDELKTEAELASARHDAKLAELNAEMTEVRTQNQLLGEKVKHHKLTADLAKNETEAMVASISGNKDIRKAKDEAASMVVDDIAYRTEPLDGETVYVSDRRIPLNGPIIGGTAAYITERINYFNNLSPELPIFIVIDSSPGGSVSEGYRIIDAMKNSDAPVHVVVKQYAASMAALITTLSDHSYALPNAVILHHQMSYGMSGNMTRHAERLERSKEWARRLLEPLAEKMGETPDRVVEMMYEKVSTGDWDEFADRAVELKWVDHVVTEIREQSVRSEPRATSFAALLATLAEAEQVDSEGNRYVRLPAPQPYDAYFMYNPDNYYRW